MWMYFSETVPLSEFASLLTLSSHFTRSSLLSWHSCNSWVFPCRIQGWISPRMLDVAVSQTPPFNFPLKSCCRVLTFGNLNRQYSLLDHGKDLYVGHWSILLGDFSARFSLWISIACPCSSVYCCSFAQLCLILATRGLQHARLPCPPLHGNHTKLLPSSLSLIFLQQLWFQALGEFVLLWVLWETSRAFPRRIQALPLLPGTSLLSLWVGVILVPRKRNFSGSTVFIGGNLDWIRASLKKKRDKTWLGIKNHWLPGSCANLGKLQCFPKR